MTETYVKEKVARRTMVKVPLSNSFLERRDGRWRFGESLGAGASLAPRLCQRISLGFVNDWNVEGSSSSSSLSQVQQLTDAQDSTHDRWRCPVKTWPGLAGVVTREIWDPTLSPGHVVSPSDFVLDSSGFSFSQTKENWREKNFYHVPWHHKS